VVKHILRYLKGNTHMGIHHATRAPTHFQGFFDANWVGDLDGHCSSFGYLFTLGCGLVY
jgi:hypothetical protein